MKLRSLLFLALFTFAFTFSKAQQVNASWTPVLISVDGTNAYNGVEMDFQLTKCGADDVVLLKLKNTNSFAVKAHWITVIKTTDGKELYGNSKLTTLNLPANDQLTGNCKTKPYELKINLSDFGINAAQFETIVGSNFDASKK